MINEKILDKSPFQIIQNKESNLILLCDHASSYMPTEYNNLGLSKKLLAEHIAFDIGAFELTKIMTDILKSNAIFSKFSRLLVDPNRAIDDPTLIMKFADEFIIPGNKVLDEDDITERITNFYIPYHYQVGMLIQSKIQNNLVPILISIHSFTKRFRNTVRPWEISILSDKDNRISKPLIHLLENDNKYKIGDNEPYKGYLRGDTLYKHGTLLGLPHVLIEIRNDLINSRIKQNKIANYISEKLQEVIYTIGPNLNTIKKFGTKSL
ncbi:MAG: N-formylglutamate amidohydrolase [Hyphomicrobiales bacterium]|nr:N-formylglutamate amidohydrolase [Hyphomicrobiales bacterium]